MNGIRSVLIRSAARVCVRGNPDILYAYRDKAQQDQVELGMEFSEYEVFFNSAVKKDTQGQPFHERKNLYL